MVATDAFRRNVQRLYLDLINTRLNGTAEAPADMRALLRGQLNVLDGEISAALSRADDQITRYHLEDARDRVGEILNPTPAQNAAAAAFAELFAEPDPFNPYTVHGCWVDFIISPN